MFINSFYFNETEGISFEDEKIFFFPEIIDLRPETDLLFPYNL